MPIIQIVIVLLIVGVLLWGVRSIPAIDATIKQIIYVLVIVCVLLWLLSQFTGYGPELTWGGHRR